MKSLLQTVSRRMDVAVASANGIGNKLLKTQHNRTIRLNTLYGYKYRRYTASAIWIPVAGFKA